VGAFGHHLKSIILAVLKVESIGKSSKLTPASTLILVKPHGDAFQVYLLRRSENAGFMPGAHVFPGGMVDAEDYGLDIWENHLDMDLDPIRQSPAADTLSAEETLPFMVAAIRETFEEAGVLLGNGDESLGPGLDSLLDRRRRDRLKPGWLKAHMSENSSVLAVSTLHRWSHWITPRPMKRRFDTRFFLARMPENQTCRPDQKETTHGLWITPRNALAGNLSGEIPLSPPALVTLHDLQRFPSFDSLMKAASDRSWGNAIEPRVVPLERGVIIIEPWDPMYGEDRIRIEKTTFEEYLLDPEEPFSRLWYDGRLWRPIRFQDHY
jgi:8-oxo-dGTP pyrophosphatase MutT (NUDIX family)